MLGAPRFNEGRMVTRGGVGLNRRDFLKASGVVVGGLLAWTKGGYRAQNEWPFANAESNDSGIVGTVRNIVTGQPIANASVGVSGFPIASTDADGAYLLRVPPGIYEIQVKAPGFMDMARVRQEVRTASFLTANFEMIPLDTSEEVDRIIYDRIVAAPEGPVGEQLPSVDVSGKNGTLAITVPSTITVKWPDGRLETMDLDYYLKGVVPFEMSPYWPIEALKAQAVTARSYAVAYTQNGNPICTTTQCQVYKNDRFPGSNAELAVDATHGQVITYGGKIVSTHYFSRCNGETTRDSERALASDDGGKWGICSEHGWDYIPYERARPCWGHAPYTSSCRYYGHGVGMCQWGAYNRAVNERWDYVQILTHYYSGISIYGSIPPPTPISPPNGQFIVPAATSVTLSWSTRENSTYYAEGQRVGGGWGSQFGWTPSTSWPVGVLPKGLYQWRVKVKDANNVESRFSEYSYFVVADQVYKTFLPRADKNSTASW